MEEKFGKPRKEKPHLIRAEKKILAEAKNELILEIPSVRGICPIVVQPRTIVILFQIEHIRIAVRVN